MVGRLTILFVAVLTLCFAGTASARLKVYWTKSPVTADTAPPVGWTTGALPGSLNADSLDLWLAVGNEPDSTRHKFLHILIQGPGLAGFTTLIPEGFETTDTSKPVPIHGAGGGINNSENYDLNWAFERQPRWERIKLFRTSGGDTGPLLWNKLKISSFCTDASWADPFLQLHNSNFDAPGASTGTPRWTKVVMFPLFGGISVLLSSFTAPPATGNWTSTFVYTDPDGNPRPGGGVMFTSDGAGLTASDHFNAQVRIDGGSSYTYDVYSYDANAAEYEQYRVRAGFLGVPGVNPWTLLILGVAMISAGAFLLRRRNMA